MSTQHPDWRTLIIDCFSSAQYMALATNGPKGLWNNPVYFAWDDKFGLYFISQLDCNHVENLLANPDVACTIYDSNQNTLGDVIGAYITGHVYEVTNPTEKSMAEDIYYGRIHPADEQAQDINGYRNDASWHMFKIDLTGLWYFDTRYFGEHRTPVPEIYWK